MLSLYYKAFVALFCWAGLTVGQQSFLEDAASACRRVRIVNGTAGKFCGASGTLKQPRLIQTINYFSDTLAQRQCITTCAQLDPPCGSFSLNNDTKMCRFYEQDLQTGFTKSTQDTQPKFFENSCYRWVCETTYIREFTVFPGPDPPSFDDTVFTINLPFAVGFYGKRYSTVFMSVNGILSFLSPASFSYTNMPLPTYNSGQTSGSIYLPDEAIAVFWDDLIARPTALYTTNAFPSHIISYNVFGLKPNREVVFRWRVERTGAITPGFVWVDARMTEVGEGVDIFFNQVDLSNGNTSTVGAQSKSAGKFVQFSYNGGNPIYQGLQLGINTVGNQLFAYNFSPLPAFFFSEAYHALL